MLFCLDRFYTVKWFRVSAMEWEVILQESVAYASVCFKSTIQRNT